MKAAWMERFGEPAEVVACRDVDDEGTVGAGEVVLELAASPVNPADFFLIQGIYAILPELPYAAGMEGVARVATCGGGVDHLEEGDVVLLPPGIGAWRERFRVPAHGLQALPADVDPRQLAMLAVNPPTASRMLSSIVDLAPGDWVVQNAANSAVGRYVIQLAAARGLRTVNVVRRDGLTESLQRLGADVVEVDGDDLHERVASATDGAAMSLEPCRISPMQLFFEGKTLRGFWIADWYATASPEEIGAVLGDLIAATGAGTLSAEVDAVYPLTDVQAALDHASRSGRTGKVLLTGPGL